MSPFEDSTRTKLPPSNRSQVVGDMPKNAESFVLAAVEVMTLDADMPGFFQGSGLQIDFSAADVRCGQFSLWLTLADAKALVAGMEVKIHDVESWRDEESQ